MSDTPTPPVTPYNPAEQTQGPIPAGGTTARSFTTGVPADYTTTSGELPHTVYSRDATGKVVATKRYYDLNNDPGVLLYNMKPDARKVLQESLKRKGLYGNATPGNGLEPKDIAAFTPVLEYANMTGKPWAESWAEYYKNVPDSMSSKKAPSVRVTSADDLKVVFKKTASDLLGRELTDEDNARFARLYQGMEVQAGQRASVGGTYQDAPTAGTVAENQIQKQFGAQAQAYKAGNVASVMDQMIKQLGAG